MLENKPVCEIVHTTNNSHIGPQQLLINGHCWFDFSANFKVIIIWSVLQYFRRKLVELFQHLKKVAYDENIEKHKQSVQVLKFGWKTATGWRENVNLVGPLCAKRQNTQGIIVNIVSCERWQNSIDQIFFRSECLILVFGLR